MKNHREIFTEEYLRLTDQCLYASVLEKLALSLRYSEDIGGTYTEKIFKELLRPETQHQIYNDEEILRIYNKLVSESENLCYQDLQLFIKETARYASELLANKLATYAVLSDQWLDENVVDVCNKIFNKKRKTCMSNK